MQDRGAQFGREPRSVVVHDDLDPIAGRGRGDAHGRSRPFAGVVEQVAEHLVEILAFDADEVGDSYVRREGKRALRVQPRQRPDETGGRLGDRGPAAEPGARRSRARVGEVVVDLAPHPIDFLANRRREIGVAGRSGAVGLVRQDRQWRLQAVRQIAGFRDRAADRELAVFEERVQIVDERLHFGRIRPVELALDGLGEPGRGGCESSETARRHAGRT